jgi:hypothetical protein
MLREHDRRRCFAGGSVVALVDSLPGADVGKRIVKEVNWSQGELL